MIYICPLPRIWNKIYQELLSVWENQVDQPKPPPKPLVLHGWGYTNDLEKKLRWEETIKWANMNGLADLTQNIAEKDKYFVTDISTYQIGPLGGSMFLPWDFTPKTRPTDDEIS